MPRVADDDVQSLAGLEHLESAELVYHVGSLHSPGPGTTHFLSGSERSRAVDPDRIQGRGSGSGLDSDLLTLWIRIWNPDPESGPRGEKIKSNLYFWIRIQWLFHDHAEQIVQVIVNIFRISVRGNQLTSLALICYSVFMAMPSKLCISLWTFSAFQCVAISWLAWL
jgi:hypothetical protein